MTVTWTILAVVAIGGGAYRAARKPHPGSRVLGTLMAAFGGLLAGSHSDRADVDVLGTALVGAFTVAGLWVLSSRRGQVAL